MGSEAPGLPSGAWATASGAMRAQSSEKGWCVWMQGQRREARPGLLRGPRGELCRCSVLGGARYGVLCFCMPVHVWPLSVCVCSCCVLQFARACNHLVFRGVRSQQHGGCHVACVCSDDPGSAGCSRQGRDGVAEGSRSFAVLEGRGAVLPPLLDWGSVQHHASVNKKRRVWKQCLAPCSCEPEEKGLEAMQRLSWCQCW